MAAKKGNQYWKLRSKHGRDKIISEPQSLLDSADEYFQWCIDNPVLEEDYKVVGGKLRKVKIAHPQVFQKGALARFCHVSKWETIDDLKNDSKDFLEVIEHIEGIIRDQKFKYATVGMFNSNIVSRDLGLMDKKNIEHSGGQVVTYKLPENGRD